MKTIKCNNNKRQCHKCTGIAKGEIAVVKKALRL